MRIAVLVIGLLLAVGLFVESLVAYAFTGWAEDVDAQEGAKFGMLVALIWVVASAIVITEPRISMVLWAASAVIGASGWWDFSDARFWSGVAVILAVLSYLGHRAKMKQHRNEAERDATMQQQWANRTAVAASPAMATQVLDYDAGDDEGTPEAG